MRWCRRKQKAAAPPAACSWRPWRSAACVDCLTCRPDDCHPGHDFITVPAHHHHLQVYSRTAGDEEEEGETAAKAPAQQLPPVAPHTPDARAASPPAGASPAGAAAGGSSSCCSGIPPGYNPAASIEASWLLRAGLSSAVWLLAPCPAGLTWLQDCTNAHLSDRAAAQNAGTCLACRK